jgi:thiosulfate/3-mercaptopyruvate sulfurtransferase
MMDGRQTRGIRKSIWMGMMLLAASLPTAISSPSQSREVPAIVSPDWLAEKLGNPGLIILDIRNSELYQKGHVPGALNVPTHLWAISKNGLSLELPSDGDLRDLVGTSGMEVASQVVVVNRNDTDFNRADAARVAWTLHIAGIDKTSILDGGYNRWVREKKTISTDAVTAKSGPYTGKMDRTSVALKSYVLNRLTKSVLADSRVPEDYFGISSPHGHIKNAVNLPTPWMFTNEGTLRKYEELEAMAFGVLGTHKSKEVILYCGVGGYASSWWFVLTRVLGYRNVKVYDGSMEEWLKDSAAPITSYSWR